MRNQDEKPRPATVYEWGDIEVCEECRNRHELWCKVHKCEVKDGCTCSKFGRLISV